MEESFKSQLRQLAIETDEPFSRVESGWIAYVEGCRERKAAPTWEQFCRIWKREMS